MNSDKKLRKNLLKLETANSGALAAAVEQTIGVVDQLSQLEARHGQAAAALGLLQAQADQRERVVLEVALEAEEIQDQNRVLQQENDRLLRAFAALQRQLRQKDEENTTLGQNLEQALSVVRSLQKGNTHLCLRLQEAQK